MIPEIFNSQQKFNSNHNSCVSARPNLFGVPGHKLRLHTPAARLPGDSTSGVVRQTTTWGGRNPRQFIYLLNATFPVILPRDNRTIQGTQTKKKSNEGGTILKII